MFASPPPLKDDGAVLGGAAGAGAIYGLALARYLFELDPSRFGFSATWPGALSVAAVGLAVAGGVFLYIRRVNPAAHWATLALALPLFGLIAPDVNPLRSITLLVGGLGLYLLFLLPQSIQFDHPEHPPATHTPTHPYAYFPISLFLLLFVVYLRTLAPAVGQADTFEFQVDVARLGIAHGSGYPLLMLVGRLFTLLPVGGTLAFRANLSSAFFAALAAVGVERLARRLGAGPLIALLAGLAFGVSPTLWSRAVELEVFALNAALVAAILYLCVDLVLSTSATDLAGAPAYSPNNLQAQLMLLAFLFGLSLTNHLTTLFLAPGCLLSASVALWRVRRCASQSRPDESSVTPPIRRSPISSVLRRLPPAGSARGLSFVILSLLLGLTVYIYIPLRWPAVNHGQALSLAGFANVLSGNEAKGAFQWLLPFQDGGRYAIVDGKIVGEFGWPGLALALLGILGLAWPVLFTSKSDRPLPGRLRPRSLNNNLLITNYIILLLLLLTYLGYVYFELAFNVPDPSFSSYIIPLHLMAAVLMAVGIQWLVDGLAGWQRAAGRRAPPASASPVDPLNSPTAIPQVILAGFCLFGLHSFWQTFPRVDQSSDWSAQQFGELMLSQPLAHGAAILADSEKIAPLDYLQIAEGRRPDLDIIVLPDEASYRSALDERLAAGQVVYLGRYLPGLGAAYSLRSVGPLAEVSPVPFTATELALQTALAQPAVAGIRLAGYSLTRLSTSQAEPAASELDLNLVWQPQTVPAENLLVNLQLVDADGQTAWQNAGSVPVSGLYPTNAWRAGEIISDFYRLPVSPSLAPGIYQLQVALLPPFAPALASSWSAVTSVTVLAPATSSTPPHFLLDHFGPNWLVGYDSPEAVAPGSHYSVTLYWLHTPASAAVTAFGETRTLTAWPTGAVVPLVYQRVAPAQGELITQTVGSGTPAQCGWLAPTSEACPLPAIHLAGQAASVAAVNFDNQLVLNRAQLETTSAAPGGIVSVNLEWQALRAIIENYTVFVHLLGPDGRVHGQIDLWPVSGTRATSSWAPGERIADPYQVRLPPDAPPGAYQVEIGLYLLATGERLPVLNADGVPVDDRLLLTGLQVSPP